jgi:hypothetical protein
MEIQFLKELTPIFARQIQLLLKFPNQENSDFQFKRLDNETLTIELTYRRLTINIQIPRQEDNSFYFRYQVKHDNEELFVGGYEHYIFPETNRNGRVIPQSTYKDNRISNISWPKKAHRIDRFIRMVDNLDEHLYYLNRENGLSFDMVAGVKKRELIQTLLKDCFSVRNL